MQLYPNLAKTCAYLHARRSALPLSCLLLQISDIPRDEDIEGLTAGAGAGEAGAEAGEAGAEAGASGEAGATGPVTVIVALYVVSGSSEETTETTPRRPTSAISMTLIT